MRGPDQPPDDDRREEKGSDVIVAVWLAGCQYFHNGWSYFLTYRQKGQRGDQATTHIWANIISFYERIERIITTGIAFN